MEKRKKVFFNYWLPLQIQMHLPIQQSTQISLGGNDTINKNILKFIYMLIILFVVMIIITIVHMLNKNEFF